MGVFLKGGVGHVILERCQFVNMTSFFYGAGLHTVDSDQLEIQLRYCKFNNNNVGFIPDGLGENKSSITFYYNYNFEINIRLAHQMLMKILRTPYISTVHKYNRSLTIVIDRSGSNITTNFKGEKATFENMGGAVYSTKHEASDSQAHSLLVEACEFVNNKAPYGGAVYIKNTHIIVSNGTFIDNKASAFNGGWGGALYMGQNSVASFMEMWQPLVVL